MGIRLHGAIDFDGSLAGAGGNIRNAVCHDCVGELPIRCQNTGSGLTVAPSPSGAGAEFYGSDSPAAAAHAFTAAAQANPNLKLFGPSALASSAFTAKGWE